MKVLIVGQGLAGTHLAFTLLRHGVDVHVVDDNHQSAASLVTTAVINPVTGRRYAKSWNIDNLLPLAQSSYASIESMLGRSYLKSVRICQVLPDPRVEEIWMMRSADPEFQSYLDPEIRILRGTPFRYGVITNAMQLDVSDFIDDSSKWLKSEGRFIEAQFDFANTRIADTTIQFQNTAYDHVVLCTGSKVIREKYFHWLDLDPMKGEYLICRIPDLGWTEHVKSGVSLIPLPEKDLYWCGSTYDRYEDDTTPTAFGKEQLLTKLAEILSVPFTVEYHGAAIRATTKDRRPYVGAHKIYQHLHLVTGLGTKGASLAPYCAQVLADALVWDAPIPDEVDILRHTS